MNLSIYWQQDNNMHGTKSKEYKTALNFTVRNQQVEILSDPNRIRPEFYEDFEDVNRMMFHNAASLADGKVCL